jgi:hypothetical protein
MMICSYLLGQKYYPVSYPLKRIGTYLGLIIVLSILSYFFNQAVDGMMLKLLFSTLLMGVFLGVVLLLDRKNFTFLPIVGKYFK